MKSVFAQPSAALRLIKGNAVVEDCYSPPDRGLRRESIAAARGDPSEIKSSCRAADLHPLLYRIWRTFCGRALLYGSLPEYVVSPSPPPLGEGFRTNHDQSSLCRETSDAIPISTRNRDFSTRRSGFSSRDATRGAGVLSVCATLAAGLSESVSQAVSPGSGLGARAIGISVTSRTTPQSRSIAQKRRSGAAIGRIRLQACELFAAAVQRRLASP